MQCTKCILLFIAAVFIVACATTPDTEDNTDEIAATEVSSTPETQVSADSATTEKVADTRTDTGTDTDESTDNETSSAPASTSETTDESVDDTTVTEPADTDRADDDPDPTDMEVKGEAEVALGTIGTAETEGEIGTGRTIEEVGKMNDDLAETLESVSKAISIEDSAAETNVEQTTNDAAGPGEDEPSKPLELASTEPPEAVSATSEPDESDTGLPVADAPEPESPEPNEPEPGDVGSAVGGEAPAEPTLNSDTEAASTEAAIDDETQTATTPASTAGPSVAEVTETEQFPQRRISLSRPATTDATADEASAGTSEQDLETENPDPGEQPDHESEVASEPETVQSTDKTLEPEPEPEPETVDTFDSDTDEDVTAVAIEDEVTGPAPGFAKFVVPSSVSVGEIIVPDIETTFADDVMLNYGEGWTDARTYAYTSFGEKRVTARATSNAGRVFLARRMTVVGSFIPEIESMVVPHDINWLPVTTGVVYGIGSYDEVRGFYAGEEVFSIPAREEYAVPVPFTGTRQIDLRLYENGLPVSVPVSVEITGTNEPPGKPTFEGSALLNVQAGTEVTFEVLVTDPNGDPLRFEAKPLPAGANLDANTGLFSWTPGTDQTGYHLINFYVFDLPFETRTAFAQRTILVVR